MKPIHRVEDAGKRIDSSPMVTESWLILAVSKTPHEVFRKHSHKLQCSPEFSMRSLAPLKSPVVIWPHLFRCMATDPHKIREDVAATLSPVDHVTYAALPH